VRWSRDGYEIDTDPGRVDLNAVHAFLRESYWCEGVPRDVVARSIEGSLVFGLYAPDSGQAGFARVVTDRATFAWLADVYVLEEHRGRGLGTWLVETALGHPDLGGVRRFSLATADAHSLYQRFGFMRADAARVMERLRAPAELYGGGGAPEAGLRSEQLPGEGEAS
jgi:GNAT superfamily N-acetyltransferase